MNTRWFLQRCNYVYLPFFPIDSFNVAAAELPESSLVVSVWDFNGGIVKDDFIGRIVLSAKEPSGNSPRELYFTAILCSVERFDQLMPCYPFSTDWRHYTLTLCPISMMIFHFDAGEEEMSHWNCILSDVRSSTAQWHQLRSKEECDQVRFVYSKLSESHSRVSVHITKHSYIYT